MTARRPGLLHAAVLGEDPDDVARLCLPEVHAALAVDAAVEVVLDRRGVRAFRDALPDAPLRLPAPSDVPATTLVERLAGVPSASVAIGRCCADAPPAERADVEDALTLMLADRRLTLLCVYDPAHVVAARRSHAWLLTPDGPVPSPTHVPPSPTSPVPAAVLGASVARLPVPDGAALSHLRHRIRAVVADAGLAGERAAAAVLAAHEAMLLACGADLAPGRSPGDLPPGEHVLDVRVSADAVVAECRGTPTQADHPPADDPRFAHLRRFCDHATVHDDRDGRTVRVLTGTR